MPPARDRIPLGTVQVLVPSARASVANVVSSTFNFELFHDMIASINSRDTLATLALLLYPSPLAEVLLYVPDATGVELPASAICRIVSRQSEFRPGQIGSRDSHTVVPWCRGAFGTRPENLPAYRCIIEDVNRVPQHRRGSFAPPPPPPPWRLLRSAEEEGEFNMRILRSP
jgi:hypothetical protein